MKDGNIALNPDYRAHLLVGLFVAIWLYAFLVLVGPFDASDLTLRIRFRLMLGYGFVFFLCYAVLIPIQNRLHNYLGKWKLVYEVAMVLLFCLYALPAVYLYYKTKIVNGTLNFGEFSLTTYVPIIAIILPILFLGRYLVSRHRRVVKEEVRVDTKITLLGNNKLDILKLEMKDLVAIEASNNYVIVHYLIDGSLQKKFLRSSLRRIHQLVPKMVKVHRSYLINQEHFVEWKDGLTLALTQIQVPVSQKYKATLLSMEEFTPI